ncbi:unnamed protein product [Amaranthus hypochondriacus]
MAIHLVVLLFHLQLINSLSLCSDLNSLIEIMAAISHKYSISIIALQLLLIMFLLEAMVVNSSSYFGTKVNPVHHSHRSHRLYLVVGILGVFALLLAAFVMCFACLCKTPPTSQANQPPPIHIHLNGIELV